MKKVLVPSVRFKGFIEEWKEEKFGETIEPYRLKNHNKEKLTSYSISNKFGFVNQKEFFENGGKAIRADKSNSLVVFSNSFAYNPARIDVGSIGLYRKEEKCLVSPIYEVFKTDRKMNDEFLFNWFKTDEFKWIVNKSKEGSVRNTVYLRNISDYLINITSYIEQQKIGKLLENIDNLISLEEIKLNKLKQLKETLLQKMFPEGNSKTPRIRFKGFSEVWKEDTIGNIAKVINGKSNTSDNNKWGQYNLYIRSEEIYKSNKYIFDVEGVITVGDGNIGKIFHYVNEKFDLHQRCYLIYEFQNIWPKYFYYYFSQNFYKRAILMSYTATVNSIRMNTITDMDIMFPKELIEQQKIGDFFSKIDSLLSLYQSKLNKLKQIKESLLQKMFV
ncbi:restriction endonuclease subunit S [Mycoplasmopsis felis]|uniref:restriction endonuclease subunit S n=1 Tax=Mycoplasmopsis felis TaxID=33923 RepID=UPI002AFE9937|nr:restriction endonuclease subunit S [Mycoplasmopsis felis]WQQ03739.1 restriction endonuclease subunit S [Mycoplasmopsis felis]